MSFPIKFFSLQKTELEYEVAIRGESPGTTVAELRKQINKLSQLFPSHDILCSHLEPSEDIAAVVKLLNKIKSSLDSGLTDKSSLLRLENLLNHIYHRINRIEPDDIKEEHLTSTKLFRICYEQYLKLSNKIVDPLLVDLATSTIATSSKSQQPINIAVTCDKSVTSELGRLKFDGKSCVRSFIERANEFSEARNIPDSKFLSLATEIFTGDALHWFRTIKDQVSSWDDLVVLLKQDFDKSDYDYRLVSEIRSRTQGETENITIFLSILSGMFARLSNPMPEEDKLEIVLHNIRPCYASTLASSPELRNIDQVKTICKNYENIQSRFAHFREPIAAFGTLAPEFAYKGTEISDKFKLSSNDVKTSGLLDSGSAVTILGNYAHTALVDRGLKLYTADKLSIVTAGGQNFKTVGYLDLPVQFEDQFHIIKAHIVPEVQSPLILGVDFWRAFKLCPKYLGSFGLSSVPLANINTDTSTVFIHSYENLDESQRARASNIIDQFKEISFEYKGLGRTNLITHRIDTGSSPPVRQRYYRLSPEKQKILVEQVDEMLKLDVVEPCESAWQSPVLLVTKKNGQPRFCLDSRKLNSITKRDAYNLPYISEILDNLRDARYLSSIDLSKAFWQLPIAPQDRDKTAFYVPGRGTFRFKTTPFGLTNAPSTQQRLVDLLFGNMENKVFAYLDDIVLVTSSFDDHVTLLLQVLDKLRMANLTVNLEKCEFYRSQLKYLGYVVDAKGLRTDPDKISSILNYPTPTCRKDLKRFLGTATWYRRFVPKFSTIAGPLNKLTSSKKSAPPFKWTDEADVAFRMLKECLVSAPVLFCPKYDLPFEIHTDASNYGVGAMLTQTIEGKEHPIAYMSRSLSGAEKNYSITERETLAVIVALEQWRCYIENGKTFTVYTDHSALKWFLNLNNPTGRLARWGVRLSSFNFVVKHRRGVDNIIPDALSRAVPVSTIDTLLANTNTSDDWYLNIYDGCITGLICIAM
ncbi:uncharacterized protein LOC126965563 [Leptidea sinapis]|uniref:uncharacterized protein LOC126965563 n=1 Tax=Leptidea sinapis TaxID=189913 RepID=UPI0021C2ADEF|nr:uncharacterized protein LOC126965563 [Leptidea sinapis]